MKATNTTHKFSKTNKFKNINVYINFKKLEYDRIDISGRINVNKTTGLPESIICHY